MRATRRWRLLAAALLGVALLALAAWGPMARAYEAALLLEAVGHALAGRDEPTRLSATTPAPARTTIGYAVGRRAYVADVYRPGEAPRAGIVLLHGAHRLGKDEPRLGLFATALARARFTVLVPDLPVLRAREWRASIADEVADGVRHLTADPRLAPGGRAGVGAFSLAVGPALLAALDPGVRDRVAFVLGVGGYHDFHRTLVYVTTGLFETEAGPRHLPPSPDLKWLFVLAVRWAVESAADRATLGEIGTLKAADPEAPVTGLAARLGPEGRALYRFVTNQDPHEAPALLQGLPAGLRAALVALDLAHRDLSRLGARLILVHGRDDNVIPYTESVALARAVPRGQARLFLLDRFAHLEAAPGWLDTWRLWRAVDALLAARDAP